MNICAVRTLKNGFGNDGAGRVLKETPLPHEPDSAHRYSLEFANDLGDFKDAAICKHCGCIYSIEEAK